MFGEISPKFRGRQPTVYKASLAGTTALALNTNTNLVIMTVPPGTYLILGQAAVIGASASVGAVGISVADSLIGSSSAYSNCTSTSGTSLSCSGIATFTSTKSIFLLGFASVQGCSFYGDTTLLGVTTLTAIKLS